MENKNGPRTDPFETPTLHWVTEDFSSPILKYWDLYLRYVAIHFNAVPDIPNRFFRRCIRISCSIVSNAADRSRLIKTADFFRSAMRYRSSMILRRAVSVLWSFLYADCSGLNCDNAMYVCLILSKIYHGKFFIIRLVGGCISPSLPWTRYWK